MKTINLQKLFLTGALLCLLSGGMMAQLVGEEKPREEYEVKKVLEVSESECDISQPENLGTDMGFLFWDPVVGATEYEVWNSLGSPIQTVTAPDTFIALSSFPPSNDFFVVVRAICGEESESDWSFLSGLSNDDCVPDTPTGLAIVDKDLVWNEVTGVATYVVWNSLDLSFVKVATESFALVDGANYTVGVQAICENGDASDWVFLESIFVDDCVPDIPVNVIASNPTGSTIDLDWDDVTDAIEYEVYNSATFMIETTTSSEIQLMGLPENTTFNIGVRAKCPNGDLSDWRFVKNLSTINADGCVPDRPTNAVASNPTGSTIDVTWDAVMAAAEYEVYNSATLTVVTTTDLNITLMGLPSRTTFNVGIRAKCSNGDLSDWNFINGVSTFDINGCMPEKPTNLVTSNPTESTLDLAWDGVTGAVEYEVYNSANFSIVTTTQLNITLMGLPANTTFNVGVRAKCSDGELSDWRFRNGVSTTEAPLEAAASLNITNGLQQNSNSTKFEVSVFPNPNSSRILNVVMADSDQAIQSLTLFNLTGRVIQRIENIEEKNYQLQLKDNLTAGIYILRIEGSNYAVSKQVVLK